MSHHSSQFRANAARDSVLSTVGRPVFVYNFSGTDPTVITARHVEPGDMALNEDGDSWIWTGLSWVAVGGGGGPGHDALTLAADADILLGLTGQELTLDVQAANIVFAGPSTGGNADPTFRSLVDADIPSGILRDTEHTSIGTSSPHHVSFLEVDADTLIATHTALGGVHHTSFVQANADALYEATGGIATHAAIGGVHHVAFVQSDADALYEALGDIATHAALNDVHHTRAHGVSVHTQTPGTRALRTTAQTIPDTTVTTAIYNSSTFDDDDWWEGVTNPERVTVDAAARYLVISQFVFEANANGTRYARIRKYNSADVFQETIGEVKGDPSVATVYGRIMAVDEADAGDYYVQDLQQTSGGSLSTLATRVWLTVQRLP